MMRKSGMLWLALALLACSCSEKKEPAEKAPIKVRTQRVSSASIDNRQNYVGIVEEREGTAVSFTSMGIVRRVAVHEGQAVARGQLIAEMDDAQARSILKGAEAQMAQANDALSRYKMLHDNGSLPEVQWVEIQSKVAQAKAQLEVARKSLSDCRLVAPVSGIIGRQQVKAGETAMPSQAVVTILDISTVKVKVSVPETEIRAITASTPTTISVEAVGERLLGGHIEKGIEADALTHTYDVRIHVANGNRKLLPGMVANVSFAASGMQSHAGMSVPVTAVQKAADGSLFVWTVAADSTAHRTRVKTSGTQGNNIGITDGLSADEMVVVEGYQKLGEGTKVDY
ncbi:MAG: efflux RND transporter periplasmic adaptor subunit [Prevotella sp.]|nr:efflux RND transporter periplasmic adaptor subunit [Prevotella sp.]